MPASGKLTVASMLSRAMGYSLIDNHYIHNFVRPFIEHRSDWIDEYCDLVARLRRDFFKIIARFHPCGKPVRYLFTNMLFDDEMGLSAFRDIEAFARAIGADFVPIEFYCRPEVLRSRVRDGHRAARGKIASVAKLKRVIGCQETLRISHANKLCLDTSDSTPEEEFGLIRAHLRSVDAKPGGRFIRARRLAKSGVW
ncbi:MAG: AAA family ATPase [Rickettsiales bacterium]|jgi:hypothetical protein|nr:AAA family ATPase [Rickettsiales bacterium]